MEWLKSLWAKWRVHVSVVSGVLVLATAYGTCTYEPPGGTVSEATVTVPVEVTPTVEVSATTTGATEEDGTDGNTIGTDPTTTTE